ncbi:hypothetical protein [Romboutsia sp. 1001713B170207_170306_H8]|uniref:hypothetical protein n=1 Tax=Romboutsia sp. 1001713B170207_170306_H8 TaxID=2787112 RepID=UPI0018979B9C|nr:hypothetical protein [Romboutsia sp. 1001713B170207_170306_H8]
MLWENKEIEYLIEFGSELTIAELAANLNRSVQSITYKKGQLGIKSDRIWTKEEVDFLLDKWGTVSVPHIAKKLGRTETSIYQKKYHLGLGAFLESGDYITWRQLMLAIGTNADNYKLESWVKNRNFPIKSKKIKNKKVRVVFLDDFWKWAEKNKSFIDFSNFIENTLGKEPSWVKEKRRYDIEAKIKCKTTPWTSNEEEYLIFLLREFKYTVDEIAAKMNRSCGAIQRRICKLGIKERPIKADNHNKWTEDELKQLDELIIKGIDYELISEKINRSAKAIRGTVYRKYGTEVLDKARKVILNKK